MLRKFGFTHNAVVLFSFALFFSVTTAAISITTDGLNLWLKADAGITLSGANVSMWANQSGSGTDAAQADGASQPTLVANAINGLPAVLFDGQDDDLAFTLPVNGLENMTLFVVSAATEPGVDVASHYANRSTLNWVENGGWGTVHITTVQEGVYARFGIGVSQPLPVGITYDTPIGEEFTIATAVMDGMRDQVYVKGELVYDDVKRSLAPVANTGDVGYLGRGYQFNWPGMVAEALVYTRTLSDAERQEVEAYLNSKYFAPPTAVSPNGKLAASWAEIKVSP